MGGCEGDRLSNLPRNIMDNILKSLSVVEAVRTSILSREWRYKWVTIPHLCFNWKTFPPKSTQKYKPSSVIYQVLLLHKGPIVKFSLKTGYPVIYIDHLDQSLQFLSNHPIEELTLDYHPLRPISHFLFAFEHLKHLYLVDAALRPPPTFKGLGRLVTLHLEQVYFLPGELKKFITQCPVLECLNLIDTCDAYRWYELQNIDTPNLKSFYFSGFFILINFKNAPLLTELSMMSSSYGVNDYQNDVIEYVDPFGDIAMLAYDDPLFDSQLIEFLNRLSSITRLELDGCVLYVLSRFGLPQKLPHNLNFLHFLSFPRISFSSISEVSCAVCLIRSSPNLRSLEITVSDTTISRLSTSSDVPEMKTTAEFLMKMQKEGEFPVMSRLEYVKIEALSGLEPEMEFVKLLLSAATVLSKLEICSIYSGAGSEAGSKMFNELLSFRPSFPNVQFILEHLNLNPI
ncbi:F-box/FBD/LRR-repeat protein At1g13570-like [Sesamum indicum]|uniref:F-box/FBD/LRR-repeat protein At1g13570-like n=1 Tax=Sesamum indicum TaxID=4182 RepID=A0A6I9SYA6_SESIN|nr:F-box/FBD/LRR-repeat protein At1g13570-like [Sesamum indicum]